MESEIIELAKKIFRFEEEDAGYFRIGESYVVVANDMFLSSTDFPQKLPPENIGWKVVTACVSDLAAMGAKPAYFSYSLGLERADMKFVKKLVEGIKSGIDFYGMDFLSGDTNEAKELVIDGIAIGFSERLLLRKNAKEGDVVCVTGDLGRSFCSLLYMLGKVEEVERGILEKFLRPIARVEEGLELSAVANSAIDVSDGLSKELNAIAKLSEVGIIVYEEKIPIREEVVEFCKENNLNPAEVALSSGEEYELLFTIEKDKLEDLSFEFSVIGEVVGKEGVYLVGKEKKLLKPSGWEHFKAE